MFLTRLLTAAVLLAAFLAALFWLDRGQFAMVSSAIVGLGGYEWARLNRITWKLAAIYGMVGAWICFSLTMTSLENWVCGAAGFFWLVMVPYWLARGFRPAPIRGRPILGFVVLIPAGLAMAVLPTKQLLMALGMIWVADTGAYLAGRAFGRRKLAPSISPGKTWEGVAGGAIGCVIYAIIWTVFDADFAAHVQGVVWVPFLAGALLLCALSVMGDLFESALKREAGAKDSGKLLPGHGGVLDRIDSATAALPVALLMLRAIGAT